MVSASRSPAALFPGSPPPPYSGWSSSSARPKRGEQLGLQHVFFASNPSSHFFYLITYTHAIHLFLGIGALGVSLITLYVSRQLEMRQILVDCTGWYWHTMGVFWIFLFALLVFFQ